MSAKRALGTIVALAALVFAACSDEEPTTQSTPGPAAGADAGDAGAALAVCPAVPEIATTTSGCVRGAVSERVISFKGIPYAAPPVGPLRWRPPALPAPWKDTRDALDYGRWCLQGPDSFTGETRPAGEDCLTLNVFRPSGASGLPVMVWFHGGGLYEGGAAAPIFDGRVLAERGQVVVVTVNYRLAALGYLAHPALSAEDPRGVSGNYGLLDQIAALGWVRDNIRGFGGDPANVSAFGNSAGGFSVCALLGTPLAAGLVHRAIIQSAKCQDYGSFARALRTAMPNAPLSAEAQGAQAATTLGCSGGDVLGCMRSKPEAEVLAKLPANELSGDLFGFTVDGVVLPDSPRRTVLAGKTRPMPVLAGVSADEGTAFTAKTPLASAQDYEAYVRRTFPRPEEILALYPAAQFSSPNAALAALVGDFSFACPHRQQLRALAQAHPSAYSFQFAQITAVGFVTGLGVYHASEQEFVFGTVRARPASIPTGPEELALSDAMVAYWSTFARTGDPNHAGAVAWPTFERTDGKYLNLGTPIAARDKLKTAKCDLLEQLF